MTRDDRAGLKATVRGTKCVLGQDGEGGIGVMLEKKDAKIVSMTRGMQY